MTGRDTHALVADIGGTNTRVALADGPRLIPGSIRRYRNAHFRGLPDVLSEYLAEVGEGRPCHGACVAAAGPVRDGRAELTNLDWIIDPETVGETTGASTVAVLNDLQAQGHAIGHVDPTLLTTIVEGRTAPEHATKLVIGVGTGFNAAPVFETRSGRDVPPSESGHASLPVHGAGDLPLFAFLAREKGFVSVEDVLSGRGLENVRRWLAVAAGGTAAPDSAAIMTACADGSDPLAREAVRLFVRTLGIAAGNLALMYLPFGGVHLVGGMSRAVLPYLDEVFVGAFREKGQFAAFMQDFPVLVVEDDYAALVGCASHLAHRLA